MIILGIDPGQSGWDARVASVFKKSLTSAPNN